MKKVWCPLALTFIFKAIFPSTPNTLNTFQTPTNPKLCSIWNKNVHKICAPKFYALQPADLNKVFALLVFRVSPKKEHKKAKLKNMH